MAYRLKLIENLERRTRDAQTHTNKKTVGKQRRDGTNSEQFGKSSADGIVVLLLYLERCNLYRDMEFPLAFFQHLRSECM
jgi:hypothetical protein